MGNLIVLTLLWILIGVPLGIVLLWMLLTYIVCPSLVFLSAVFDRIPLQPLRPENDFDSRLRNFYQEVVNWQAQKFGFATTGVYRMNKRKLFKGRVIILQSASLDIIVMIYFSGFAGFKELRTSLITQLSSELYLRTMDFPEHSWLDSSNVEDEVLFNADFGELLTLHTRRIQKSAAEPVCNDDAFSATAEYLKVGLQSLIQRGLAKIVGSKWRYTIAGACQHARISFYQREVWVAREERIFLKRPGHPKYVRRFDLPVDATQLSTPPSSNSESPPS